MNRQYVRLVVGLALTFGTPATVLGQSTFSDVTASNPAYAAVSELAKEELLFGYPDATFGGRRAMRRREFALALWRVVMRIEQRLAKIRPENIPPARLSS